jgi:hypothetical protein
MIRCFVVSMLLIGLAGCLGGTPETAVEDYGYSKVHYVREADDKDLGAHSIGFLKFETAIDGRVYKGWLHLHENGVVSGGTLAKDARIDTMTIPAGTWVSFNQDDVLLRCRFPGDRVIDGHACVGTGGGLVGAAVDFHSNGRLAKFYSPGDVKIQSVPCRGGLFTPITLYRNGRLESCTLSDDYVDGERLYEEGRLVRLDDRGRIIHDED